MLLGVTALFSTAVPVSADVAAPSDAVAWSGSALQSTTAPPLPVPLYECAGSLTMKSGTALAYAQCTIELDQITYQWTWTDELTGAVLYSGSGAQANTTSLSTSSAVFAGTVGHRTVTICFESDLQGYVTTGDKCPQVFHQ
jgi:hypothetical protein